MCYGLKELLDNITRQQLAENLGTLLPTVQGALVDSDAGVRQVSFASIHRILFHADTLSGVTLSLNVHKTIVCDRLS